MKNIILAIDFDGTIVTHKYPEIGDPVPHAIKSIKEFEKLNCKIMLWTMRSGKELEDAVEYLKNNGIELWGINKNCQQSSWTNSNKQYAHYYIDDAAIGCPLIKNWKYNRPYVNWLSVKQLVLENIKKLN